MDAFREFKSIWDPDWKMNPGKVIDAYPVLSNLRIGAGYNPPRVETHFKFPKDKYTFSRAALRCVGVGKCRRDEGGVMCPSYMVTREEMHSTRGRGSVALGDAERRAEGPGLEKRAGQAGTRSVPGLQRLQGRLSRQRRHGDVQSRVPVTLLSGTPAAAKRLQHGTRSTGGLGWRPSPPGSRISSARLRRSATSPNWSAASISVAACPLSPRRRSRTGSSVVPFADSRTSIGRSSSGRTRSPITFIPRSARPRSKCWSRQATKSWCPATSLCCGRPLYDFGMLDKAQALLQEVLGTLRPEIRRGIPLVGLEPSCLSVFRDELVNLFPHDEDAKRLNKQCFTLSEFLANEVDGYEPPKLNRKAIVQGHCHHRSVMKMDAEMKLLKEMGLEIETPEPGCCGMAGSFGFESGEHYRVSMACGERALLPAVRHANAETLIIADGFSCQEQIAQSTQRNPLHFAQVLQMALRQGPRGPSGIPERQYPALAELTPQEKRNQKLKLALTGAGLLIAGGVVWAILNRKEDRRESQTALGSGRPKNLRPGVQHRR